MELTSVFNKVVVSSSCGQSEGSRIVGLTLRVSQGLQVLAVTPSMEVITTTFPDRAPEMLLRVLQALNVENIWSSQASLVESTSALNHWTLEMSLALEEGEGEALLSSLIPDRVETPGRKSRLGKLSRWRKRRRRSFSKP